MLRDAPPSRDDVTTSFTCRDCMDVKTFTNSGITAPASVPQVITSDSFHHRDGSPPSVGIIILETTNVSAMETMDVSQTSMVRGASKSILSALAYRALVMAAFRKYESPDVTIMMMRI